MQGQDKKPDDDKTSETPDAAAAPPEVDEATQEAPAQEHENLPAERLYTEDDVQAKLDEASAEAKERMLRVAAEYENFRRRVQKEREQWTTDALERFVADLLPVLDDFDRALAAPGDAASPVLEGVRLTDKQLRAALARHGVEAINPSGQKFDPKLHEAIQRAAPSDVAPPGTVVAVYAKGYTLKGKLLRPARVQVSGEA
jgi:molecular chaperone GrpE